MQTNDLKPADFETDEPDLMLLLKALWKGIWLIVVAAFVFGSVTYIGTKIIIEPTYQVSFTAYVNNRNTTESTSSLTSSDLSAARSLVYTYSNILTSQTLLKAAAAQIGLSYDYTTMIDMVSTNIVSNTEIITVTVTSEDPYQALSLAEAICEIAPDRVANIVEGTSMQIIDEPSFPTEIAGPNYLKCMLLGAFVGAVIAAAAIVLKELLDNRVRSVDELEKRLNITVIGVIHDLNMTDNHNYGYYGRKGRVKQ